MKKHGTRKFLAGMLTMALVMVLATPAWAALTSKTITVLTGSDIYVDGIKLEPTDANGNPVETFIYNGTTYVPLRAVSESLGKSVKWDGTNKRAYIGEVPGEKQYLLSVCPPYQTNHYEAPTTMTMMGQKYANGLKLGTRSEGYALFNLNGQYDTLSFDVGHIDGADMCDASLNVYLDGTLAFSLDLTGEMMVQHYDISLHGALQMKIEMADGWYWGSQFGLANVTVE